MSQSTVSYLISDLENHYEILIKYEILVILLYNFFVFVVYYPLIYLFLKLELSKINPTKDI